MDILAYQQKRSFTNSEWKHVIAILSHVNESVNEIYDKFIKLSDGR